MDASRTIASTTVTFQVALFIPQWYDQTGNLVHSANATAGQQPQVLLTCLSNNPCAYYNGSTYTNATYSKTVTGSWAFVAKRTASTGNYNIMLGTGGTAGNPNIGFTNAANTLQLYSVSTITESANDNEWHSVQGVTTLAGTSSLLYADGSGTSGNAGTSVASTVLGLGNSGAGSYFLNGYMTEAGAWQSVYFTLTQIGNVCNNQYTYWGTATSC
jgi:hypothetical protein